MPGTSEPSILGTEQFEWLTEELRGSTATWKIVGNQKPVAPILGLLTVIGESTWNGFPDSREQLFDMFRSEAIDNVVMLSGDAHITVVADLHEDPEDPASYDPATGDGAVGVEFQPGSLSRGTSTSSSPTTRASWMV